MKRCPECAEEIQDAAIKCRYCGARFGRNGAGKNLVVALVVVAGGAAYWKRGDLLPTLARRAGDDRAMAPADEATPRGGAARGIDVQAILPSVVRIENVGRATGSGFLVSAEGHVLTSAHVLAHGKAFRVQNGKGDWWNARVVDEAKKADLALLLVEPADGKPVDLGQPLPLGDATALKAADPVTVIGYPLGFTTPAPTSRCWMAKERRSWLGSTASPPTAPCWRSRSRVRGYPALAPERPGCGAWPPECAASPRSRCRDVPKNLVEVA